MLAEKCCWSPVAKGLIVQSIANVFASIMKRKIHNLINKSFFTKVFQQNSTIFDNQKKNEVGIILKILINEPTLFPIY